MTGALGLLRHLIGRAGWASLIAGIVLSGLYLNFFAFKAHVELEIKMFDPVRAWFRIYWADEGAGFSEDKMEQVLINGNETKYSLFIGNLSKMHRLRIDPVEHKTKLFLKKMAISQPGFATIELNPENRFVGLLPVQQIDQLVVKEDGLRFNTTGRDGFFEYILDKGSGGSFPISHIIVVLGIMLGCVLVMPVLGFLNQRLRFVPALLLVVLILAFVMAVISKHFWLHPNGTARIFVHPDEEAHSVAVEYYGNNWLPPAYDDPQIKDSYSVYGYTRLASYELYYPITGYLTKLLKPFKQPYMWDVRLVGLFLVLLIVALSWRRESFRPFAAPLLLTPQAWYFFSYSNSDGFALLLATLAAWQVADRDSSLNLLWREQKPPNFGLHLTWLGLLAGALLLCKLNFYFFILFIGLYLLWRIIIGDFPDQKRFWLRSGMIVLVALSVYGARYLLDVAANGFDAKQKMAQMIEQKAEPLYKPSTELSRKHIYLYMKDRGVTLSRILNREYWAGKTFISTFGAYGYTQYLGSRIYYDLVSWVGLGLLGVMLLSLLLYAPASLHWLFAITMGSAVLLVAASLYQSWTISFQAQGRYLAPILPMLGVLYYHARPWLMTRTFNGLLFALFGLGVYSFVFIGLTDIPKYP